MSSRDEPHWGEISLLNWVSPVLWNKAKTNQPQNDHSTPNSHRAHQLHSLLLVGWHQALGNCLQGRGNHSYTPWHTGLTWRGACPEAPRALRRKRRQRGYLGGAPSASCPPALPAAVGVRGMGVAGAERGAAQFHAAPPRRRAACQVGTSATPVVRAFLPKTVSSWAMIQAGVW